MTRIFSTHRLDIRKLESTDWEDFILMNTNKAVMEKIGKGEVKSLEEQKLDFDRFIQYYTLNTGMGVWAVNLRDQPIMIGAASLGEAKRMEELHIGYRLKQEFWGKGYATEIAQGLIQYGIHRLNQNKLGATTNLNNEASIRVLKKTGFILQHKILVDGVEMNYFIFENPQEPPSPKNIS